MSTKTTKTAKKIEEMDFVELIEAVRDLGHRVDWMGEDTYSQQTRARINARFWTLRVTT